MFIINLQLLLIFICALLNLICAANFPRELVDRCSKNDRQLNTCLLRKIDELRPKLKDGIPEFGIKRLQEIGAAQVAFNIDNLTITLNNPIIYGIDNFDFKQFDLNVDETILNVDVTFPNITMKMGYLLNGKLHDKDFINKKGILEMKRTQCNVLIDFKGYHLIKDGKEYLNFNETTSRTYTNSINFDGDGSENIQTINDPVLKENIKPYVEEAIGSIFKLVALKVFDLYSIDELFL